MQDVSLTGHVRQAVWRIVFVYYHARNDSNDLDDDTWLPLLLLLFFFNAGILRGFDKA